MFIRGHFHFARLTVTAPWGERPTQARLKQLLRSQFSYLLIAFVTRLHPLRHPPGKQQTDRNSHISGVSELECFPLTWKEFDEGMEQRRKRKTSEVHKQQWGLSLLVKILPCHIRVSAFGSWPWLLNPASC